MADKPQSISEIEIDPELLKILTRHRNGDSISFQHVPEYYLLPRLAVDFGCLGRLRLRI